MVFSPLVKPIKKEFSFSLIWKALFAVTVSTLLASGSIFVLGKYTYNKNHEQKIAIKHQQYEQAFASVLRQLKQKETELSWLIPTVVNANASQAKLIPEIVSLIDNHWFKIELESDIRSVYLFNTAGQLKGEWGGKNGRNKISLAWLNNVINKELPQSKIVCDMDCFQFHALPFLHKGKFAGIFVFVSSTAEIVLQMKEITGADIAVLIHTNQLSDHQQQSILPLWSSKITALTDFSRNYKLLSELQYSYPDTIPTISISYVYDNNTYDIFAIPFGENNPARLIIIDNISQEILEKQRGITLYLISGLSSILLSGVILFLLFIRPTTQLKKIINLLPLIAEKRFNEVRRSLPGIKTNKILKDEIDILASAAHNLIQTLSRLDHEVEQRNLHLLQRSKELKSERNFVSNILNSAQVVIMRLDQFGQIVSLNLFGEKLIGYEEVELANKHFFTDLIYDNESYEVLKEVIPDLLNGKYTSYNHECTLFSLEGFKLYISWFFTVIHNPDAHPEILVVGVDLTERRAIETELAWLADHDPLTRLFNRRRFEKELQRVLLEAERFKHKCALIFFDVDQFKYINDSSGHQVGDQLLIKVSENLSAAVRSTDIIARLGGDEFVVLAPQITQDGAQALINKIFSHIMDVEILLDDAIHKISISAGLLMLPVPGHSEQDLMASVDIAMYKAKEAGRGIWCWASLEDLNREDIKQRVNWKARIEKALAEERFVLYFQPIMRIADRCVSHYECLLRMIDENGDIIPPVLFIGVAEQTGLISFIDKKVLEMAILKQKQFTEEGLDIVLSVNLSGDLISNPDAFQICSQLLEINEVRAEQFIFEVTETQAVTNLQSANSFIAQLTAIGGKFALDDFGVGFSSMNYLKQLPVQYLKIDGEFIRNLPGAREDKLFVKAINEVGHGMNIKIIAEYVENNEIFETLSDIGVDYAQGFGIGRPMPYPEFHQTDPKSDCDGAIN